MKVLRPIRAALVATAAGTVAVVAAVSVTVLPAWADTNIAASATATASSTYSGYSVNAIKDGVVAGYPADASKEWASNGQKVGAWARLTWSSAQSVTSVVLFDRPNTADQVTSGTLTFSDGSSLPVGALVNNASSGTTVSFAAKTVTWVQLTVDSVKSTTANVGLAEFEVYGGSGPSPSPTTATPTTPPPTSPPPGTCTQYRICVVSPAYGSTVTGNTVITIYAPGMQNLACRAWHQPDANNSSPNGYDSWFAILPPDPVTGLTQCTFPASQYPHGPTNLQVSAWDSPAGNPNYTKEDHVYWSLYNDVGVSWNEGVPAAPPQAAGMSVAYLEDFSGPLSTSRTGAGATYASTGPYDPTGAEFGDAIFAEQSSSENPFAILENEYLRIRGHKAAPGFPDPKGWGRTYVGGMLSSLRTDGTGFATTYGYFEARIKAPGGYGPWPAFWVIGKNRVTEGLVPSAELDAVELHAQSTNMKRSSRAVHCWRCNPDFHQSHVLTSYGFGDSGNAWHLYGVKVTSTDVIYYLDNVEVWRMPTPAPAHGDMFFMVDLAMGSGFPIDLSYQDNKADMYVDYVRVFD
ncbi:glycoside hydrolase family 16 protein [Phytohabitans sp. ZYX-F-186]|uniref:Glycoside hydrolase family 16 protein n=1 Tax=Phytohabitans maris TaxID=3071409 RepID=A0ABU0ZW01_9ACTN|nr:glycoside hydrolase family 16 protein [Phytohabitans sp. ZYX-F-186]MDQ7911219.1 glycoside hydrolase family 16 protein [Phytohabitans sp. ZYX-F-186]